MCCFDNMCPRWRWLRTLGCAEADVDDLVQEVFVTALRQLPKFEGRASAKTWLYTIARHTASHWRRKTRWRRGLWERFSVTARAVEASPATPAQHFEAAEALAQVHRILDTMPVKRREIFVMFELEGLSGRKLPP